MKKKHLLGALCACVWMFVATTAPAATVNYLGNPGDTGYGVQGIDGLLVDGVSYDVQFTLGSGSTYENIWLNNATTPVFLNNQSKADIAADAIVSLLFSEGNPQTWSESDQYSSYFWIPFAYSSSSEQIDIIGGIRTSGYWTVRAAPSYNNSINSPLKYAVFTPSTIPIPPAVWLFGSGLLGLIGMARRKKA